MSFISSGVEYALHCLLFLSKPINASGTSVRDLAELQNVPVDFLAKLFTKLRKAGLVTATEGIKGGFTLAKPAEQITINDVVLAIDGHKSIFKCREIRTGCAIFENKTPAWATTGVCGIHAIMLEAEQKLRETLSQYTLADIAQQLIDKAPKNYTTQIITWLDERSSTRLSNND